MSALDKTEKIVSSIKSIVGILIMVALVILLTQYFFRKRHKEELEDLNKQLEHQDSILESHQANLEKEALYRDSVHQKDQDLIAEIKEMKHRDSLASVQTITILTKKYRKLTDPQLDSAIRQAYEESNTN